LSEIDANLRIESAIRELPEASCVSPALPTRIGSYRILREIGRGGMGVVYEAEQDNPRRLVALKMIKPELASPQTLRRFADESLILGRLQHPGIAQIYEAATVESGDQPQPYFAMERVVGVPLWHHIRRVAAKSTEDADSRHVDGPAAVTLGIRDRLTLIAKVCDAVQHAHQKGVIHRDLNPNNILVDDAGEPKILDFGVARMIDNDLKRTTLHTDVGQLIGTIPYMSPEQVSGNVDELDTRCDIYSLGVLAYELLTGRLPYTLNRRMIPEALRVIREEEPVALGSVNRSLRGDIETMVGKALHKDKALRYATAAEFALDIRRHLNNEPISARPLSLRYQLSRFARRHRGLVWGFATAIVILIVGAALTTWESIRANRAESIARSNEERARDEAAKSGAVNDFLQEMLGAANPENSPDGRQLTVHESLGRAVARLDNGSLAAQPEIEAAVRGVIGNTYRALGDFQTARTQLERAVNLGRTLHPEGSADLAFALNKLGRLVWETGDLDQAESLLREALAMRRQLHGPEHEHVATMMNNLGFLLKERGRFDEAQGLLEGALAMRQRVLGPRHVEVASSLNNLALLLQDLRQNDRAEALLRESLAMDRELRGDLHPNLVSTMNNLAWLVKIKGDLDEAESLFRECLELNRNTFGEEHVHTVVGLNNLASTLRDKGEYDESEQLFHESLTMARRLLGDRHWRVALALANLGALAFDRGDLDRAESWLRESLDIRRDTLGEHHPDCLWTLAALGRVYLKQGQPQRAEPLFTEVVNVARQTLPAGHELIASALQGYGECLTALGRFAEAEATLLESHELLLAAEGPPQESIHRVVNALVELYEAWGNPDQAAQWRRPQ
jgi:serine/threonine protein kinase/Tfp pilus assembly protein PilF